MQGLVVRDLAGRGALLDTGLLGRAGQRLSHGSTFGKHSSYRFTVPSFLFEFQDLLVQGKKDKAVTLEVSDHT